MLWQGGKREEEMGTEVDARGGAIVLLELLCCVRVWRWTGLFPHDHLIELPSVEMSALVTKGRSRYATWGVDVRCNEIGCNALVYCDAWMLWKGRVSVVTDWLLSTLLGEAWYDDWSWLVGRVRNRGQGSSFRQQGEGGLGGGR